MTPNDKKRDFREHLERLGFVTGGSHEAVWRKLRKLVGEHRYAEYLRVIERGKGGSPLKELYDLPRGMREANLLRSLHRDVAVDVPYSLYEMSRGWLVPGARVIELGSWTGSLASFIAAEHPTCTVVGADRAGRMVEVSRAYYRLPNLIFVEWDYTTAVPAGLEPADVLVCSLGIDGSADGAYDALDPHAVRGAAAYAHQRDEATSYFRRWREAARDGAHLLAALRLGTFARFLAYVDAAQAAGWCAVFDECGIVAIEGGNSAFPVLSFRARAPGPLSEDRALAQWIRMWEPRQTYFQLHGGTALGMYRSLREKYVLAARDYRNDLGFAATAEIGLSGPFGYVFTQDARPEHVFTLVSMAAAELEARKVLEGHPASSRSEGEA